MKNKNDVVRPKSSPASFRVYAGLAFASIAIVSAALFVVSRRSEVPKTTLEKVAATQGWSMEDTRLWQSVRDKAMRDVEPTPEEWTRLCRVADRSGINFVETLVLELPRHLKEPKYQSEIKKWCVRLMNTPESSDPYAALVGYTGYCRTDAGDKGLYAAKLRSRGGQYPDKVDEISARNKA